MRRGFVLVIAATAAVLSGCGSSSNTPAAGGSTTPTASTPTVSVPVGASFDCAKYVHTSQQISEATAKMFSGSVADFNTAMNALDAEFAGLKDGAPSDVKAALDDMTSVLRDIGNIRAHPTTADQSHLQSLATKLPTDGAKIAAYITTKCH